MSRHSDRLRMADTRILVVEDEQPIRDLIAFGLRRAGCDVALAEHSQAALASIGDRRPDLVLVDWMLPDMSGIELVRVLRRDANTRDIPVMMLTARGEEADKVAGLESGADDYVTKPFSARELVARIQAVLRRSAPVGDSERVDVEGLSLDQAGHRVTAAGTAITLGPTEYRLLAFLMTHPDRVYSRSQLLDRVWGGNVYVEERTVDVHIRRLRKALEESGYDRFVQTVRGAGYRFSAQPD
jgi:two-component system, OmpR family, phosphate regulon response regulator PhoB